VERGRIISEQSPLFEGCHAAGAAGEARAEGEAISGFMNDNTWSWGQRMLSKISTSDQIGIR